MAKDLTKNLPDLAIKDPLDLIAGPQPTAGEPEPSKPAGEPNKTAGEPSKTARKTRPRGETADSKPQRRKEDKAEAAKGPTDRTSVYLPRLLKEEVEDECRRQSRQYGPKIKVNDALIQGLQLWLLEVQNHPDPDTRAAHIRKRIDRS